MKVPSSAIESAFIAPRKRLHRLTKVSALLKAQVLYRNEMK